MSRSASRKLTLSDLTASPAMPMPDRRGEARVLTILRIARLVTDAGDELCMIRNIAAGGAKLRVYAPRQEGERVMLELRSGECVPGAIRWVSGDSAGVAFDEPIDAAAVLACQPTTEAQAPRPPRLNTRATGSLTIGSMMLPVTVADVSQGGAKIVTDMPLPGGADATLSIAGLGTKKVQLRWQRPGTAGLAFLIPLTVAEVTDWTNARRAELPQAVAG